jgi:chromosome segregation ATPase
LAGPHNAAWSDKVIKETDPMVCKMVKRGVLGALAGAGVLALLFGTAAPSYVKTAFHKVRHSAHRSVPIQFDIDRARQQVADLEPELRHNIETIAQAEVDIETLDAEIASTRANLDREGKALLALREHLNTGDLRLTKGVSYTDEEIKSDLARRLDHYKAVKQIVAQKENTLNLRKKALVAAREQNAKMRDAKRALMTKIEEIETRLRQIEASQAANEFNFDDSALARAKQTVAELNKRVEVLARVAEQEGQFAESGVTTIIDPSRDVVREVDAEFGKPTSTASRTAGADKDL